MEEIVEKLKHMKGIGLEDIEANLPPEVRNRFLASRILRQMINYRIVSANNMQGKHLFLSETPRAGDIENLNCVDRIILFCIEDIHTSYDDIISYVERYFKQTKETCFFQKCLPERRTVQKTKIDWQEQSYLCLERLIYAGLIEEYLPLCFGLTQKARDKGDVAWELLIEKIESCSRFQRFIQTACEFCDPSNWDE